MTDVQRAPEERPEDLTPPQPAAQQPIIVNVTTPAPAAALLPPRSTGTAYVLWLFFGALGVHQFYLGNTGRGLLYLFTLGLLTVGVWIDLFTLPGQVRKANARRAAGIA